MTGYAENSLVRGLSFLAEKQAAIANNLANVNTTSFKRRMAVAAAAHAGAWAAVGWAGQACGRAASAAHPAPLPPPGPERGG